MISSLNSEVETQIERLISSVTPKKGTALAHLLGVKPQAVSNAKTKGVIPKAWFVIVSEETGVSADWLLTGEGPMHRGEVTEQGQPNQDAVCSRCERLEADNRELMTENRELNKENRELMRENGDLRVELAEIKARAEYPNETSRKAS